MLGLLEESSGFVEELVVLWPSFSCTGFDTVGAVWQGVCRKGSEESVELCAALGA
jgi:hypothetical protein